MEQNHRYLVHFAALLGLMIAVQALFLAYQNISADTVSAGLENHIDYASREKSPMALVRATHQLESLGLLTCVSVVEVKPRNSVLMDMTQSARCAKRWDWQLGGIHKTISIHLGFQHIYRLQFRINNPRAFYIALWMVRLAVIFGYLALVFGVRSRIRAREIKKNLEKKRLETMTHLAAQVAHDIRSPLAALDNTLSKLRELPENERILVRTAVNRIKDIANNLLKRTERLRIRAQPQPPQNPPLPNFYLVTLTHLLLKNACNFGLGLAWKLIVKWMCHLMDSLPKSNR